MIDNKDKVAVVFGVRNENSIAYNIALKLHNSGCKVALSYVADTKADVLHLVDKLGLDAAYIMEVDVRNEEWRGLRLAKSNVLQPGRNQRRKTALLS
jgi:enoyl-[acyl-carrier protein] reductase I